MADEPTTDAPAAAPADAAALIARGLAKPAATAPPPTSPPPAAKAADAPLTMADVERLVAEGVHKGIAENAGRYSKERADAFAREQFIRSNMMDLPPSFAKLMPDTGDMKAMKAAEQEIRAEFRDWYAREAKAGRLPRIPNVGGEVPGEGDPASGVVGPAAFHGVDSRSATEKIAAGLRKGR